MLPYEYNKTRMFPPKKSDVEVSRRNCKYEYNYYINRSVGITYITTPKSIL